MGRNGEEGKREKGSETEKIKGKRWEKMQQWEESLNKAIWVTGRETGREWWEMQKVGTY